MSQHFYPGTAVTGDRAAAATVQGAPCFTDAGQPSVVVQIQCSLIPCRSRQAPVIQRGRVRASIAFMYPRPRKHRLCIHTPACLGYALEPYALREQHQDRARGPQEPPGAAPISFQDPGQGFPCPRCRRPGTGPLRRPGGGSMPRLAMLAADLRRSCRADLRSRTQLQPGPPRRRTARRVFVYVHIYGQLKTWL